MIITPGTFVRLKHDPSRAGVLENGEKYTAGAQMVEVRFADGQVKWCPTRRWNLSLPRPKTSGTALPPVGSSSRTGCAARSPGRE